MGATRWTDWCEWKVRCALGRCSEAVRHRLADFALQRMRTAARRAAPLTNLPDGVVERLPRRPEAVWHLLETHAVTTQTREGKAYKEWLFARAAGETADAACATVEAGATLMLRDVTRNLLSRECLAFGTLSLDARVAGCGEDGPTYRDLLPDTFTPADALAARELEELAAGEAKALFEGLAVTERVGLAAKFSGVPLGHPRVLACCDCGRSMLFRRVRRVFESLPERLAVHHPDERGEDLRAFCVETVRALERFTFFWVRVDSVLPDLFQVGGGSGRDPEIGWGEECNERVKGDDDA